MWDSQIAIDWAGALASPELRDRSVGSEFVGAEFCRNRAIPTARRQAGARQVSPGFRHIHRLLPRKRPRSGWRRSGVYVPRRLRSYNQFQSEAIIRHRRRVLCEQEDRAAGPFDRSRLRRAWAIAFFHQKVATSFRWVQIPSDVEPPTGARPHRVPSVDNATWQEDRSTVDFGCGRFGDFDVFRWFAWSEAEF